MISVLIPARNEPYLQHTIDDVLRNATGEVEVLVGLDGWDTGFTIYDHPKIGWVYREKSIGQRAMTNELAKLAKGKYVMKLDAHCSFKRGFDEDLLKDMEDDITLVPSIGNLHAYDWVCPQGHKHFQGKYDACEQCGSTELKQETVWKIIHKPIRSSFYFDTTMHFQYMPTDPDTLVHDTMSIQGSCFMATKEKYFELNLCDEAFGSWGQQGVEVALKTWLSGGRIRCTRRTFYGHQFRETEGFPYLNPVPKILEAQQFSRNLFLKNAWPKQIRSFQSVIGQFNFPGDWTPEKLAELASPFTVDNS